ncbi:hypothetical protein ACIQNU_03310 [Streptomyces sp. NPDC091292]|uniref:hypothetical protein n=1 Tax=Streptomyces sp. NPDC091292 TaxID=3365991 RepID=UPI0037FB31DE
MPIAVVRAETYYLPPRPLPPNAWTGVPGAELVYHWIEYRMGRRVPLPDGTLTDVPPVYARINQNRWLADCVCGSAAIVSPVDPRWGCTECGYGWVAMVVPTAEEITTIERELLLIPQPHLRNWWNPGDPNDPTRPVPPVPDPGPMSEPT